MHDLPVYVIYLERLSILYLNIDYLRLRVVPPAIRGKFLKLDQRFPISDIENNVLSKMAVHLDGISAFGQFWDLYFFIQFSYANDLP